MTYSCPYCGGETFTITRSDGTTTATCDDCGAVCAEGWHFEEADTDE